MPVSISDVPRIARSLGRRVAGALPARPGGSGIAPLLQLQLGVIALLALAVPTLVVSTAPRIVTPAHETFAAAVTKPRHVVPKTVLPPVEPIELAAVAPDDARAINAAIPFSTLPNPAARAFHLSGAAADQARATDCLAAAVYFEAGDDAVGERAVAQVILNRLRHPAFPKTICGVVFQGSERRTGCQFTFTCDGALARTPSPAAWDRARTIARAALTGTVYRPVGHATHYHTDWVVPYWSASLEKITEVHSHLFFRWTGWWGTPAAFSRSHLGSEPVVPLLARLSPAHRSDSIEEALARGDISPDDLDAASLPRPIAGDVNSFLVTLDSRMGADAFAALAVRTCGERPYCKFMAWTDASRTPRALPLNSAQVSSMAFSYLRDETQGFAKALWNCDRFQRPSPVQCMRAQPLAAASPTPIATPGVGNREEAPVPALSGVRRRSEPRQAVAPPLRFNVPGAPPPPANAPSPSPTPTAGD